MKVSDLITININFFFVLLLFVFIVEAQEYKRSDYGSWKDDDNNCLTTRHEVLKMESLVPVVMDKEGCKVIYGRWYDLYTGKVFTDPKKLDIDHFVPLKEAHLSGAEKWSKRKKEKYANDLTSPYTLVAVSLGENRSKGSRDPSKWLPKNKKFQCDYVRTWVFVKNKWKLTQDPQEVIAINQILSNCKLYL